MPSYLVGTYLACGVPGECAARERQARSVTEELTREGTRVRFEVSAYVPEDEMRLFMFVVEAVSSRKE